MTTFEIINQFDIDGVITTIEPLGNGLINDTFCAKTESDKTSDYVLQRINHSIFKDVEMLQNNIVEVTNHIRKKLKERGETDIERKALQVVPAKDGKLYFYDGESYWRVTVLIPRVKTYEAVTPEFAYFTGKAFGDFQAMLADMPVQLGETIPNFHNLEWRLEELDMAMKADKAGRLEKVKPMVDDLLSRAQDMCKAEQWFREGKLPKRINHCDTKVNNMLFDENGNVLCVIDLDTTMPGFVFSDFGDFIRTAGNTGAEDDENTDNVNLNPEIFKSYAKGYIESASSFLLPIEIDNLFYGAKRMTYMQTVRFLTDYINGDTYYKIKHPEHNWQRSLAQFKLLQSLEAAEDDMNAYIQSLK